MPLTRRWIFVTLICLAAWGVSPAEEPDTTAEYVRANYTKFEYRVPMRDGVKLFTTVYTPNDTSRSYPFLLFRTPYSVRPYGADRYRESLGPYLEMARRGYIFVYQDVRGKYMSEGQFVNMRPHRVTKKSEQDIDESSDTYDTIEWLLANVPHHNGKAGLWGLSYPGFYSSAGMIDSHPALRAVSPQAPIADWYWDDMHHHGAFILPLAFNFFSSFGRPRPQPTTEQAPRFDHETPDGYQFFLELGPLSNANALHFNDEIPFWNDIVAHPNYDAFWQSRNILPHLKNIDCAVMTVGGWFDTEDLYGPLKTYAAVERNNPGISNVLVMGPWAHGGWLGGDGDSLGSAEFGFETAAFFRDNGGIAFFEHYLKDQGDVDLPEALVFETGANRWRRFDAWPPRQTQRRRVYLHDDGRLAFDAPPDPEQAFDEYVSDPSKPVPYTMEITTGWARNFMTEDQRFAAWRPDVLVYRTDPLEQELTLAGPLRAELWVSTTGTSADWVVKIIDVFPNEVPGFEPESEKPDPGGRQMLVRGEVFRGRFRDGYETPLPFVSGEPARVSFELQDLLHTFKKGHRLMVQIQSTWFPFVDRNPQRFVPNIFEAREEDFIKATHRVHRSRAHASHVEIGVLE